MRIVNLPFEIKSDPPFPLRICKPGSEWLVELCWPEDDVGHVAICGLFHSVDYESAKAFYGLAQKIISCWLVDVIWHGEGKVAFESQQSVAAEGSAGQTISSGMARYLDMKGNTTAYVQTGEGGEGPSCHVCGAVMVQHVIRADIWICKSCGATTGATQPTEEGK